MDERYRRIGDPADRVIEECAELIKAIAKAKRFGWTNFNPNTGASNLSTAWDEMSDVIIAIEDLRNELKEAYPQPTP